jgi:hypothetical protein
VCVGNLNFHLLISRSAPAPRRCCIRTIPFSGQFVNKIVREFLLNIPLETLNAR